MNDFQIIAFSEQNRTIRLPRHDFTISFHDHSGRADLQLLEQAGKIEPVGDLFFFSVEL